MLQQRTIHAAEYLHQQRLQTPHAALRRRQRLLKYGWRVLVTLALISTVLLVLVELADSVFQLNINDLRSSGYPIQFILLYFLPIFVLAPTIALFYVRLLIKTLTLSVDSIVREKAARTWDFLKLSDVRPRSVIFGKVLATFRTTFGEYLLLGVLRIGVVTWFGLTMSRMSLNVFPQNFDKWSIRLEYPPEPQYLLMACAALPVLTLFSGLFTVVVGVLSGLFLKRPQIWVAWGVRTAVLVAVFLIFNFTANIYFQRFSPKIYVEDFDGDLIETTDLSYEGTPSWTIGVALSYTGSSFLDNGYHVNTLLISHTPVRVGQHTYLLWALVIVPVIYIILIAGLLWLTVFAARRQGM